MLDIIDVGYKKYLQKNEDVKVWSVVKANVPTPGIVDT
jgi:hypothetical protein